ncbi:MAG: 4-(cytidine 5'-diphospho)-2-C-methyl-D-erythritol kinase [Rhodothermia bacterium]|nr:MAG: 4-(cytidine 5'-diphospho)-2-C-methyl-D-erythritol kinase [Rhodothermia bacterium]
MTSEKSVHLQAPAKINLGLLVLAKRSDGYHDIQTVFLALDWFDQISISPFSSISMTCSDPTLPTDERNLVMRAALLLAERCSISFGAAIHLEKNLPHGAGLGSGSSDAAATLMGLTEFWSCEVSTEELLAIAAELGSDVPFFLDPRPAIGEGRGERLTYIDEISSGSDVVSELFLAVITPPLIVSTEEAYSLVRSRLDTEPASLGPILKGFVDGWQSGLSNDFEKPIFKRYPELNDIKQRLIDEGAMYSSLSGSGSAVFGLFESEEKATRALDSSGYDGWVGSPINT